MAAPFSAVILDPSAAIANRTQLPLHENGIFISNTGIDWGDSTITAFEADGIVGSAVVDYRMPNRNVVINLICFTDEFGNVFQVIKEALTQKVALFQREGGVIQRAPGFYADIQNATLTFPDVYSEAGELETNVVLNLECLPDFYGDEIALDTIITAAGAGVINSVLKQGLATAIIEGDHPARCRIVVSEQNVSDQGSLIGALRSRHYDSGTQAQLIYHAKDLTPLNGAVTFSDTYAVSGTAVHHTTLPPNTWVSILSTRNIFGQLTHQGSYRVWCRMSNIGTPVVRLAWGVSGIAVPTINAQVGVPSFPGFLGGFIQSAYTIADLGFIRIDSAPIGANNWVGVIQALVTESGDVPIIDQIYLQPIDESAWYLERNTSSVFSSQVQSPQGNPSLAVNDASNSGTIAWDATTFTYLYTENSASGVIPVSDFTTAGTFTQELHTTGYGFSIPTTATITGFEVQFSRWQFSGGVGNWCVDGDVDLIKAGTRVGIGRGRTVNQWPQAFTMSPVYGSPTDLWDATWTPAQVNASNFGVTIAAACLATPPVLPIVGSISRPIVNKVHCWVYYTLPGGLLAVQDAVVYKNATMEVRTDGVFRADPANVAYGTLAPTGDLPRLPPSGYENRPVEILIKSSAGQPVIPTGNWNTSGDDGATSAPVGASGVGDGPLANLHVQVIYRPCWLFPPL